MFICLFFNFYCWSKKWSDPWLWPEKRSEPWVFSSVAALVNNLLFFSLFTLGQAVHSCDERDSVHQAVLLSLYTRLQHANLWHELHWGLLTTHAYFHVTPLRIEMTHTLTLQSQTVTGWLSALSKQMFFYPAAKVFTKALS